MEEIEKEKTNSPKRVVYLLGAGATQAEVDYQGGEPVNLLMKNSKSVSGVSSRIIEKAREGGMLTDVLKESEEEEVYIDIEKLISLLSNTGIESYKRDADTLRTFYREDILENIVKTGALEKPDLAIGLLEMHNSKPFGEETEKLIGIISLNHDNLFQIASQKVYGCINLGFEFKSSTLSAGDQPKAPLLIQLHGSFNWLNRLPIEIVELRGSNRNDQDVLWIPPTILKEAKDYPFNKLMGLAYEILARECDILRVIGCSLSQNDWNIISLLFNAQYSQRLHNEGECFRIELIMDQKTGKKIMQECSCLKKIVSIKDFSEGSFEEYEHYEETNPPRGTEFNNPFKYWLKEKALYHSDKDEINLDLDNVGTLREILLREMGRDT